MGNKSTSEKKSPMNSPEKLIFLDIDGVLNNAQSDISQLYVMEKDLLKLLKKILKSVPKCGLVLSSTWRYTQLTRDKVKEFFNQYGVPAFISCTPNLGTNRVDEILCWLQDNTDFNADGLQGLHLPTKRSKHESDLPQEEYMTFPRLTNVTHFIAIDDMDLATESSEFTRFIIPRFVHIDKKDGLTEANVLKAIELLMKEA